MGRAAKDPLTRSDVEHFITKLPPLVHEFNTRLLFVEREQESIAWVNKERREQMQARLEAEKKADKSCMQNLKEVTEKLKSASVLKNVRGAEDADQVFVSTFDQLLNCENISAGRRARQWFGPMTEDSFKSLCRTRETHVPLATMQSSVPSRRENLLLLGIIGLLAIIGFNDLFKPNYV